MVKPDQVDDVAASNLANDIVKKIQEKLSALERSFDLFYRKYEDMGKGIERAAEAYRVGSGHIDRYKRHLDETLQLEGFQEEVEALPAETSSEG